MEIGGVVFSGPNLLGGGKGLLTPKAEVGKEKREGLRNYPGQRATGRKKECSLKRDKKSI